MKKRGGFPKKSSKPNRQAVDRVAGAKTMSSHPKMGANKKHEHSDRNVRHGSNLKLS